MQQRDSARPPAAALGPGRAADLARGGSVEPWLSRGTLHFWERVAFCGGPASEPSASSIFSTVTSSSKVNASATSVCARLRPYGPQVPSHIASAKSNNTKIKRVPCSAYNLAMRGVIAFIQEEP